MFSIEELIASGRPRLDRRTDKDRSAEALCGLFGRRTLDRALSIASGWLDETSLSRFIAVTRACRRSSRRFLSPSPPPANGAAIFCSSSSGGPVPSRPLDFRIGARRKSRANVSSLRYRQPRLIISPDPPPRESPDGYRETGQITWR
jgi:hypothetical protein